MSENISKKTEKELISNYELLKNNTILSCVADCFKRDIVTKKKGERVAECGSYLAFDSYKNIKSDDIKHILTSANFCKCKWCLMCASRKCDKILAENISIYKQIKENQEIKFVFVTFTLAGEKPLNTLKEHLNKLSSAFKELQRFPRYKKAILGYFRGVEYFGDNTKDGFCHPHYHCLFAVRPSYFHKSDYIKQDEWLEMWRRATKDYRITQVNVKGIRAKNKNDDDELNEVMSAFCEVGKYCVKPDDVSRFAQNNLLLDFDTFSKGVRQFARGGIFKDYKPILDDENILNADDWQKIASFSLSWENNQYLKKEL